MVEPQNGVKGSKKEFIPCRFIEHLLYARHRYIEIEKTASPFLVCRGGEREGDSQPHAGVIGVALEVAQEVQRPRGVVPDLPWGQGGGCQRRLPRGDGGGAPPKGLREVVLAGTAGRALQTEGPVCVSAWRYEKGLCDCWRYRASWLKSECE